MDVFRVMTNPEGRSGVGGGRGRVLLTETGGGTLIIFTLKKLVNSG